MKRYLLLLYLVQAALGGSGTEAWTWLGRAADTPRLPELEDGYGVVFRDVNGDRFPDLYVVRFRNLNRLLLFNPRQGDWQDRTIPSGLGGDLFPGRLTNLELGAWVLDLDNDGLD
ncbi:MAG: hypothetical protein D6762_06440, partial [Candidatus Neomarinimicrobiota bacterium]